MRGAVRAPVFQREEIVMRENLERRVTKRVAGQAGLSDSAYGRVAIVGCREEQGNFEGDRTPPHECGAWADAGTYDVVARILDGQVCLRRT